MVDFALTQEMVIQLAIIPSLATFTFPNLAAVQPVMAQADREVILGVLVVREVVQAVVCPRVARSPRSFLPLRL